MLRIDKKLIGSFKSKIEIISPASFSALGGKDKRMGLLKIK
jgi:hypothetical protein